MENNLENKLSMYQKVQGFLTLNASSMASLPIVATLKTQLDAKISAILAAATTAGADITGFTVDKQLKRNDLKTKTLKLSTAIVVHAAMTDNVKLKEKCDESPASIDKMRDNDFYTYARLIIAEATPIMASLVPYGVVAADLTNATTSSATYLSVIQAPRVQINERSRSFSVIETLFSETDTLLNDKLDQAMKLFLTSNVSLHNGYLGARAIDQTRGSYAPDYSGAAMPNTISLVATVPYLAGRTFEVENLGSVPITFSLSTTANVMEDTLLNLAPGEIRTRVSANLNLDIAADKLLIQNQDLQQAADYKIWVVE